MAGDYRAAINVAEQEEEKPKNQGQEIDPIIIEERWISTKYNNNGFEYKIEPLNLGTEEAEQQEIEILDGQGENYIKKQSDELGIDSSGYVSPTHRIYQSISDPKIQEMEPEE